MNMPIITDCRRLHAATSVYGGIAYARILLLCLYLLPVGVCPMTAHAANASPKPSKTYVIVLASAPGANLDWQPPVSALFDDRRLFVTRVSLKGKDWERLELGFFDNREQADSLLPEIRKLYPGAWIGTDTPAEKKFLSAKIDKPAASNSGGIIAKSGARTQLSDEQLDSLVTRAKSDFTLKKYPEAIRLFTAVAQAGPNRYSQEALELLGLCRQRNGQDSHAYDIYTQYLEIYPEGEGSKRVRQRLSALITKTRPPRENIRMSSERKATETLAYGSWSQLYRRDTATTDDTGTITVNSQMISYLDLTAISKNATLSHKGRFTADDNYDFLDNDQASEFRFIEMYYEMAYRETGTSARLGRQSLRIGGILKRFDGVSGGYQFTPELRLNLFAGYPVDIDNKSSINSKRKFYGFSFETGTFLEHWNMNIFHFQQFIHDYDDITSNGFEIRYSDGAKSLYGMVDYDYLYRVFNLVQFNANLNLPQGRSLYLNAYLRKSPLLATTNALIGRQESSIAELEQTLNIEQIRQLALDRSASSQTISLGGTQPISEKFQVTSDITLTRTDGAVASGGVDATPETGPDYFLNIQLVGNNLFLGNDTGILGLRYLDSDTSNTLSLIANSRFPITRNWRINPRVQFDMRKLANGRTPNKWRTLLRTDYRYVRSVRFDFEIGYDYTSEDITGDSSARKDLYFSLGYRWDF